MNTPASPATTEPRTRRITGRGLLRTYLRTGGLTGLIIGAIGAANLGTVLLSYWGGMGFSYYVDNYSGGRYPGDNYVAPDPRALDVVHGIVGLVIGLLFGLVHFIALRRAESVDEKNKSPLARLTTAVGALIFGLAAIISLYEGLTAFLNRNLVHGSTDMPGTALSTGIVFGAIWIVFMIRAVRQMKPGGTSQNEPIETS